MREPEVLPGSSGTGWSRSGLRGLAGGRPSQGHVRRRLIAALLSCLLPGAGQLYLGHRRRGTVMLLLTALCVAVAVGPWSEPAAVSRMLVQPRVLLVLLAIDVGVLAFRLFAVLDSYRLVARRGRRTPANAGGWYHGATIGLAAIVLLTAAPHAAVAYYDLQAHDLLTSVFSGSDPLWQASEEGRHSGGNGMVTAVPGRVTVLLVGGDAGPGRQGLRTDTIVVASLELASGRVSLFGLPRNLVEVPLPDGPAADLFRDCRCFPGPLNELYAFGREHPDLFPHSRHPGIAAVAGAAEELLDLPIDHYALVDLLGFVDVVDALGGVTVDNARSLRIEIDRLGREGGQPALDLPPGRRHLDGFTALAYSRSRETTSDYDRMERQRCVLGSPAGQTDPSELLAAFPWLVRLLKRSVVTDIPTSQLPGLLDAAGARRVTVAAVGFTPPTYSAGWRSGYPIPDVPEIQGAVRRMTSRQDSPAAPPDADPRRPAGATRAPAGATTPGASRPPACSIPG